MPQCCRQSTSDHCAVKEALIDSFSFRLIAVDSMWLVIYLVVDDSEDLDVLAGVLWPTSLMTSTHQRTRFYF